MKTNRSSTKRAPRAQTDAAPITERRPKAGTATPADGPAPGAARALLAELHATVARYGAASKEAIGLGDHVGPNALAEAYQVREASVEAACKSETYRDAEALCLFRRDPGAPEMSPIGTATLGELVMMLVAGPEHGGSGSIAVAALETMAADLYLLSSFVGGTDAAETNGAQLESTFHRMARRAEVAVELEHRVTRAQGVQS